MRILVIVGSDLPENRKMSKGYGFLGTINQPRVSQHLSHTLTEYDDGQQVNIPVLVVFDKISKSFWISEVAKVIMKEKLVDCNEKKFANLHVFADSKNQ